MREAHAVELSRWMASIVQGSTRTYDVFRPSLSLSVIWRVRYDPKLYLSGPKDAGGDTIDGAGDDDGGCEGVRPVQ